MMDEAAACSTIKATRLGSRPGSIQMIFSGGRLLGLVSLDWSHAIHENVKASETVIPQW